MQKFNSLIENHIASNNTHSNSFQVDQRLVEDLVVFKDF